MAGHTSKTSNMPTPQWAFFFPLFAMMSVSSGARIDVPPSGLIRDIEYTRVNGESLRLDAFLPNTAERNPAVVIVHGGGWVRGNRRTDVQPLFKPLSDAGFAWFSIDYRLAADVTQFGLAVTDVEDAVKYITSHAAEFHIDPERIALVGESAGGQLAAMAALRGGSAGLVKTVVALYAPTDLVALLKNSNYVPAQIRDSVRGTPWEGLILAGLAELSPINSVRRNMPPFLFIHGTADTLVPFEQSRDMCDRMKKAGAACELYVVEGAGHGIRWWESSPRLADAYKRRMVDWLRQELGGPERSGS